jgi:ubiquinone/menaquinone biosynthesis C-methylase UbiE
MCSRIFPRVYDAVMTRLERGPLARWRRSTVRPARGAVLEIGAGTGLDFPHYDAGTTVIATDPDVAMLARAKSRARDAEASILLVVADAEALPFRAGSFDGGVVGLAVCTIPHPDRAMNEMRRVLRDGGELRLLEHVRVNNRVLARLQDLLTPLWMRLAGGCRLDRDAVACVAKSGFAIESVRQHLGGYVVEIVARTP